MESWRVRCDRWNEGAWGRGQKNVCEAGHVGSQRRDGPWGALGGRERYG